MAIINTVNRDEFINAFDEYNRSENFSIEARGLIFDYLDGMGENVELDPIAICCEFSEMEFNEVAENYSEAPQPGEYDDVDDWVEALEEYLNDNTLLIGRAVGCFTFADF